MAKMSKNPWKDAKPMSPITTKNGTPTKPSTKAKGDAVAYPNKKGKK